MRLSHLSFIVQTTPVVNYQANMSLLCQHLVCVTQTLMVVNALLHNFKHNIEWNTKT